MVVVLQAGSTQPAILLPKHILCLDNRDVSTTRLSAPLSRKKKKKKQPAVAELKISAGPFGKLDIFNLWKCKTFSFAGHETAHFSTNKQLITPRTITKTGSVNVES